VTECFEHGSDYRPWLRQPCVRYPGNHWFIPAILDIYFLHQRPFHGNVKEDDAQVIYEDTNVALGGDARMAAIGRLVAFALLLGSPAIARQPPGTIPDPGLHAWFESLRQPNSGLPCCSISDCHFVVYAVRGDHYEIEVDGDRYAISGGIIVSNIANPTGRAIACYTFVPVLRDDGPKDIVDILCFVPPLTPS